MSLTGLFLITFLIVHLLGNLQLLAGDNGVAFNRYAAFMAHNPLIKFISFGLYFFILLHAVVGILLWRKNASAKGIKNEVSNTKNVGWASNNMALLGILVFAFLLLHMGDFWYKMKFVDDVAKQNIDGEDVKDLYSMVETSFKELWIVIVYLVGLLALSFHLWHGFESAFQTLGINHSKYTPIIRFVGRLFSIIVPLLFAIMPLYFFIR
jgi:succinate dehydrogenase / fumarate reductase cytochrome b subunit